MAAIMALLSQSRRS